MRGGGRLEAVEGEGLGAGKGHRVRTAPPPRNPGEVETDMKIRYAVLTHGKSPPPPAGARSAPEFTTAK
jgi:hypothetical protein